MGRLFHWSRNLPILPGYLKITSEWDHYTTQYLGGHGYFNAKLHKFRLKEDQRCDDTEELLGMYLQSAQSMKREDLNLLSCGEIYHLKGEKLKLSISRTSMYLSQLPERLLREKEAEA